MKIIKLCIMKQIWENFNNIKRLLLSITINCIILMSFFYRMHNSELWGIDFMSLILIYSLIWCVLMAFTAVNDIILETNNAGITEQIFLSSCSINKYVFVQVVQKSIFTVIFITVIFCVCNIVTHVFQAFEMLSFFFTLMVGIFSIVGAGYIISSISLLLNYKNIAILTRIFVLAYILKSDENICIPFSYCKKILIDLFNGELYLWEQSLESIIGFIFNSLLFFVMGNIIFSMIVTKRMAIKEDFK